MIGDSNMIPRHRRQARIRTRWLRRWGVTVSIYAASLLAAHLAVWHLDDRGPTVAAASQDVSQLDDAKRELADLEGRAADLTARVRAAQQVAASPAWATLLLAVEEALGDDAVLASCVLTGLPAVDAAAAPGRPVAPAASSVVLSLTGYAQTHAAVAELVLRLERIGVFQRVHLRDTKLRPVMERAAIYFDIECILIAAAD